MKTIIFLYDYSYLNESIEKKCNEYYKILIVQKNKFKDSETKRKIFDEIIIVDDIFSLEGMSQVMSDISMKHDIYRIITSYENTIEVAGYLRSRFHIPGIDYETSILVRDKYKMKALLKDNNIVTAAFDYISDIDSAKLFIHSHGYPVIVKPVNGAATKATYKINNEEELKRFHTNNFASKYLIEKYISGKEYHVDAVVQDGIVMIQSVASYLNNMLDCIEGKNKIGSIAYPGKYLKKGIVADMLKINQKVIQSIGIKNSVCHSEFFVTPYGDIIFSEIAARIGGGPLISPLVENTQGVNLYDAVIDVELENKIIISESISNDFIGFICFNSENGEIKAISNKKDFAEMEGLVLVQIDKKVGDTIQDITNTTIRCGHIILKDSDFSSLENKLIYAFDKFFVEVG
ncbi:ATP-grasp domain-containing protein [Lacrimispora sp.]|uniref:ATP-grasp domain-containing protein n=1 Tax=Lacrimispora sp. TaxID=2719234 RepID=UPI0028ABF828|nr:ATP-grasp domain-containing protein [Lacrimispora sp.]